MKKVLFPIIFLVFFVCGCEMIFPSKKKPAIPGIEEKEQRVKISGPLLAMVNDWAIGADDFKNYLNNLKPLAEAQNLDIESYEFKRKLLNDLVKNQILAQIAKERGIDKDEDVIRALGDYKSTLLASKISVDLERRVEVSYEDVRGFYEQNKQFLKKPQEMKVREIVVNSEPRAKDIYIRLLQGEDFATLVKQYSDAESAKEGGDLGYLTYDPEKKFEKFWEMTATLDKGETSSIFRSEDGKYYIVKVEDVRGGQEIPLVEVESDLKEGLKRDKIEKEKDKLIDSFKVKSRVQINEDLIR
ncbi:MAG: peptidylprolyl isomerase [Candidatus Omnitrophica bacterium]|nr:peptidylprolyl isomerase [Candidatus Omnitrophota bacterium]